MNHIVSPMTLRDNPEELIETIWDVLNIAAQTTWKRDAMEMESSPAVEVPESYFPFFLC